MGAGNDITGGGETLPLALQRDGERSSARAALRSGFQTFFPLWQRFRGDEDALILIQMWIWIPFQKSMRFLSFIFERDKMNFLSSRFSRTVLSHTHVPLMEERRRPRYSAAISRLPP